MASRKQQQLPEQTKLEPLNLDDLFHKAIVNSDPICPPEPIATGLSDEEDAARYLAQRFNPHLLFCPNCEATYDQDKKRMTWCP